MTAVFGETYIIEFKIIGSRQWIELGRSPSSSITAFIPFRGVNTWFYIRGRGYNSTFRDGTTGPSSSTYGPFLSYQEPEINASGHPIQPYTISVSWIISEAYFSCYVFTNFSIECEREGTGASSVTVGLKHNVREGVVTGLVPNSVYICLVFGTFTVNREESRRGIMDEAFSMVVTFTLPLGR